MSKADNTARETWVDSTRALAALLVVFIHTSGCWLCHYGTLPFGPWMFANSIDAISRVSVPLFFMLSGYLLLKKPVVLGTFFQRRAVHVVIPWIAWSAIYCLWNAYFCHRPTSFLQGLSAFVAGKIAFHLWFLYALAGLYLFVPILSWLFDEADTRRLRYFIGVWAVAATVLPVVNKMLSRAAGEGVSSALDLCVFGGYSGYMALGLALGKLNMTRRVDLCAIALFAGGAAVTILATALATVKSGAFSDFFYGYLTPNVTCMAAGAFVLLRRAGSCAGKFPLAARLFAHVSAASFGIYLVHPMFLALMRDGCLGSCLAGLTNRSVFLIPVVAALAFASSYALTSVIRLIPFVRRIV